MGGVTGNLFPQHQHIFPTNIVAYIPGLSYLLRGRQGRSHLVAETLGSNDGNLIADSLVGLEIEGQLGVVSLNDDLGGLLDSLGTDATHDCGWGLVVMLVVVGIWSCRWIQMLDDEFRGAIWCADSRLIWAIFSGTR
jgi:hypothetical protein